MIQIIIPGLAIKDGYLTEPGSTWRDASTWVNTRGRYKINNFRGYNATGKNFYFIGTNFCADKLSWSREIFTKVSDFHANLPIHYFALPVHNYNFFIDIIEISYNIIQKFQQLINYSVLQIFYINLL